MPRSLQPDRKLFGVTLALCLIGTVMVFSASAVMARDEYGNAYYFLLRQVVWIAFGIAGMFWLMNTDYRKLRQPRVIFTALGVTFLLLIAVFFLDRSHGVHRWIKLGPLNLQPSEFAKLAVIFYLAWFLELRRAPRGEGVNNVTRTLLPALGTVLLMVAMVYKEPDLGTACMIFFSAAVMLFIAGISIRYVVAAAAVAVPVVAIAILSTPYRLERVKAFFSPASDPQGHGFQLLQSLIAVGSGGVRGVGYMDGAAKLFYLPEPHTDYIFANIAQELGLIGSLIVVGLFVFIGWRGMRAAILSQDMFARFLAFGITATILMQAFFNISVVLALVPTKGITLPFVSYGGTSLFIMLALVGVLLNVTKEVE